MGIADLQSVVLKVRKLTGTGNTSQLTNSDIIDYINSFYLYDFPAQFRSLKLKDRYTFNTQRGIDTYPFDCQNYTTVEMPCYCAKREIKLFQDPWSFFGVNFNWQQQEIFATGNGGSDYTGTALATPILRSVWNNPRVKSPTSPTTDYFATTPSPDFSNSAIPSRVQNILITVNVALGSTLNVTDDGNGGLIGDIDPAGTNTIDYETGDIDVSFGNGSAPVVVPSGENINIQYNPMTLSIPLSVMFFQNQFTLRPVPDKGYTVELIAYRTPVQALLGSTNPDNPNLLGTPELLEWWETLAVGAAKKIYEERLDSDGVQLMDKQLAERYSLNMTRTYAQLGKQSMSTIFRDQLTQNYGSGQGMFGIGG